MKDNRWKLFPLMLMLIAGSITSIMTYFFQYEIKTALLVLLSVLLIFYCLGYLFVRVILSFDEKNEQERKAKELEEGVVVEKEGSQEEPAETASEVEPEKNADE